MTVDRRFYWLFGLAGFYVLYAGFPHSNPILDILAVDWIARLVFCCGMFVIASYFYAESLTLRQALGWSAMLWLVCAASTQSDLRVMRFVMVLPLVAFCAWPGKGPVDRGWFSGFPEPLYLGLICLLGLIGAGMITAGTGDFRFDASNMDVIQLGLGTVFYLAAYAVLFVGMRKIVAIRIGKLGYSAALAAMFIAGLVEIATAPEVRTDTMLALGVVAMLGMQVMRHWHREDGWLKLIETALGGLIVGVAIPGMLLWEEVNRDPWGVFQLPEVLFAYGLATVGLWLIWSHRIWLREVFRRMMGRRKEA